MDQEHTVRQYTQAIRTTRASIGSTLDELRGRVHEATDWRHYVDRYPATSLSLALGLGVAGGRWLGGVVDRVRPGSRPPRSAPPPVETRAAGECAPAESPPGAAPSWQSVGARAGTRLEAIATRLVDEMASSFEAAVVPAILTRFRSLLGIRDTAATPGRWDRVA